MPTDYPVAELFDSPIYEFFPTQMTSTLCHEAGGVGTLRTGGMPARQEAAHE